MTVERNVRSFLLTIERACMAKERGDLLQGTLDMLVLKAIQLEPMHGWGITERIEQWSEQVLQLGQGTLYPALLKLEQMDWVSSKWAYSDTGRRVKVYTLTKTGRKQLARAEAQWHRSTDIIARFFNISEDPA